MGIKYKNPTAYTLSGTSEMASKPIKSPRDPLPDDIAEEGQLWINTELDRIYILLNIQDGEAIWQVIANDTPTISNIEGDGTNIDVDIFAGTATVSLRDFLTFPDTLFISNDDMSSGGIVVGGEIALHYNDDNTSVGKSAMVMEDQGSFNSAFGNRSLNSNSGDFNSSFGDRSLTSNTTGSNNSSFGRNSLRQNTEGENNSSFGSGSMRSNTLGESNSAFGYLSMTENIDGGNNSSFGSNSLGSNTDGSNNSCFGYISGFSFTSGSSNSSFGSESLSSNEIGNNNCAFGSNALQNAEGSSRNVAIGHSSLQGSTSGNNITAIGDSSFVNATSLYDSIGIGRASGFNWQSGFENIMIGNTTGGNITSGNNNLFIGTEAGDSFSNTSSESNIFIGSDGSSSDGENNTLVIGNDSGTEEREINKSYIHGIHNSADIEAQQEAEAKSVRVSENGRLFGVSPYVYKKRWSNINGSVGTSLQLLTPINIFNTSTTNPDVGSSERIRSVVFQGSTTPINEAFAFEFYKGEVFNVNISFRLPYSSTGNDELLSAANASRRFIYAKTVFTNNRDQPQVSTNTALSYFAMSIDSDSAYSEIRGKSFGVSFNCCFDDDETAQYGYMYLMFNIERLAGQEIDRNFRIENTKVDIHRVV